MKAIRGERINGALIPFTLRPENEQTIDHEFLLSHFGIEKQSKERNLYGRNRPQFASSIGILVTDLGLSFEEK
jgi:predicted Rossmann fold nucleotide-binding protein DprA/Smf involved in DNA uptake